MSNYFIEIGFIFNRKKKQKKTYYPNLNHRHHHRSMSYADQIYIGDEMLYMIPPMNNGIFEDWEDYVLFESKAYMDIDPIEITYELSFWDDMPDLEDDDNVISDEGGD